MSDAVMLERIAARRAELDLLEELVKRLAEVRDERDELVVAERVMQQISEQSFGEYLSLAPAPPDAQVGGRSVLLIPARAGGIQPFTHCPRCCRCGLRGESNGMPFNVCLPGIIASLPQSAM